jgi:ribonucleotide reductase alpha subunit
MSKVLFSYKSLKTGEVVETTLSANEIESLRSIIWDSFINNDKERQQWIAAFFNGKQLEQAFEYQIDLLTNSTEIPNFVIALLQKFKANSPMFI